jgi:hypothetical protein
MKRFWKMMVILIALVAVKQSFDLGFSADAAASTKQEPTV